MRIMKYVILFFTILLSSFTYTTSNNNLPKMEMETEMDNPMVWVSEWKSSDNFNSDYGKGRFFYRFSRSKYPVDSYGNYKFEISFISDSYYPHYMYNGTPYRCATKIESMTLYVNDHPYVNNLTNTSNFWIIFQGDFSNGYGDVRVSFLHKNINPSIYIEWSQPKPF